MLLRLVLCYLMQQSPIELYVITADTKGSGFGDDVS